jgi:hypothetical protein
MIAMNDDEGWLESYVLKDANYNIKHVLFYKNLLDGLAAAQPFMNTHDLLVCGHTSPKSEMAIDFKNRGDSGSIHITELLTKYKAKYIATCYWNIKTNQPTQFENTPGFAFGNKPCHYMINDKTVMDTYLTWLKQLRELNHGDVKTAYNLFITPKLREYAIKNKYTWKCQLL